MPNYNTTPTDPQFPNDAPLFNEQGQLIGYARQTNLLTGWRRYVDQNHRPNWNSPLFVAPDGAIVSKSVYDRTRRVIQETQTPEVAERFERWRRDPGYRFWQIKAMQNRHVPRSFVDNPNSAFNLLVKEVIAEGKQPDKSPGGALARLLEFTGLRPTGATWPVGETNSGVQRAA